MGLRNASVRHPNEVVMAPALTETTQPHNFKLTQKPNPRSLSLSLKKFKTLKEIVGPLSLRDAKPDVSDLVVPDVGMNGHSPTKTTYSINGLSKSGKNEFLPLDKCNPTKITNQIEEHVSSKELSDSSTNYTLTHIGGFMMNSSCNSMEDSENMGLQKSNQDLSALSDHEGVSPSKEKMSQGDVDQLFKNLGVVIPDEIANSGELGQNVDEILQVINNIDGSGDIQTLGSTPSDSESIFRMSGNDIAGTLTSFERELFNEVDMMNMCCVDDSLVNLNKETVLKDRLEEARKKQFQLKRKCEFLVRRLRKLQSRTLGKHVCDEVTGVLEYTNNIFDASNRSKGHSVDTALIDFKCDIKGVSLSNLSLLMRQMENSAVQQANYLSRNASKQKYFGSGSNSSTAPSNGMRIPGTIIPSFKPDVKKEIQRVTGELEAQLSMVQSEIDSDLTASSSGCDSCDEFVSYTPLPQQQQPSVPINKRALWKYSLERGLVASRWTWLQARMADLEYKIRQTNEIRRQLRLAKGSIRLKPAKQQPTNGSIQLDIQPLLSEGGCSRTVGVIGELRKRRLVRSEGLHFKSKRAGRPTSVKCTCRLGSMPPCLICTGRVDPTSPQDPTLPLNMRLAYIDPAFHPQLSLYFDVSQSIHYNAVMKCHEWQSKAGRVKQSSGRLSTNSGVVIGAGAAREAVQAVDNEPRRYRGSPVVVNSMTSPSLSSSLSTLQSHDLPTITTSTPSPIGLRRRNPRGRRRRVLDNLKSKQRKANVSMEGENSRSAIVEPETSFNGGDSIKYLSPVPSPTPSKDQFRRKRENSYDIDNIVIPYCMAASTRPEKLHYKEILTPKWRLIRDDEEEEGEAKNGGVRRSSHELEGEEDASEEAALARHERCEEEERKKFLSYLKVNRGGRGQRRTDSRAESSGPNTPGENQNETDGGESREAHPHSDVLSPVENSMDSEQSPSRAPSPPPSDQHLTSYMLTRKRTVSGGSTSQPKSPPIPHPEIPPYDPRVFPLSDLVYQKMIQEQNEFQQYPAEERSVYKNCDYDMFLGSDDESNG